MIDNKQLSPYSQEDILKLFSSGSISPRIDSSYNLIVENTASLFLSAITIPLENVPTNPSLVEAKYSITFTEL